MERQKVAMLAYQAGSLELPKHEELDRLSDAQEFWDELARTAEDQLLAIHLELFAALGLQPPPQRGGKGDGGN